MLHYYTDSIIEVVYECQSQGEIEAIRETLTTATL